MAIVRMSLRAMGLLLLSWAVLATYFWIGGQDGRGLFVEMVAGMPYPQISHIPHPSMFLIVQFGPLAGNRARAPFPEFTIGYYRAWSMGPEVWQHGPAELVIKIPYRYCTPALLLLASACWWLGRRPRRRALLGKCSECKYDMRAHKLGDRCPECGSVFNA